MKFGILVATGALLVTTGTASADTFSDCESARNYGWNTAAYYVTVSLKKAACEGPGFERGEQALAKTLRRQRIQPNNPEAHKVCFYQGLYLGYVEGLAAAYANCGGDLSLLPSVARAATTVFTAMTSGLDTVDADVVDRVFDGIFPAPSASADDCATYVEAEAGDGAVVAELVDSVCRND